MTFYVHLYEFSKGFSYSRYHGLETPTCRHVAPGASILRAAERNMSDIREQATSRVSTGLNNVVKEFWEPWRVSGRRAKCPTLRMAYGLKTAGDGAWKDHGTMTICLGRVTGTLHLPSSGKFWLPFRIVGLYQIYSAFRLNPSKRLKSA